MGFIKLSTTKAVQANCIKGSFSISKKGKGTFFVSVPSALAGKAWDAFDKCDISLGDGEDAGLLKVYTFSVGAFRIGRIKSSLVFRVPQQPEWLCGAFDSVELEMVANNQGSLVVRLPKQLFEAKTYAQADRPLAGVAVAPRPVGKPILSIIGTTVENGQKRVKLTMPQYKLFSALWKAWGEPVRGNALQVALGDLDHDLTKLLSALDNDIATLGLTVEAVQGGYKLFVKA